MLHSADVHRLLPAFLAAAEAQSFSAAARLLGITPAAVSKSVRQLELRLNIVLFVRNTHYVVLTAEGEALRQQVAPLWKALGQALENPNGEPEGVVRVSVIPGFARYRLMPLIPAFHQQYPKVHLDLDMEPRQINLLGERIDVAIGQRTNQDPRLIMQPIQPMQMILAAAPGYLNRHGQPHTIEDLHQHQRLVHRNPGTGRIQTWLTHEGLVEEHHATLIATNPEVLVDAALAEMGLVYLAEWYLSPHVARGNLVPLLQSYWPEPIALWVKYPEHRLAPRTRVFVDFLLSHFKTCD